MNSFCHATHASISDLPPQVSGRWVISDWTWGAAGDGANFSSIQEGVDEGRSH